jgi:hypothetical protein
MGMAMRPPQQDGNALSAAVIFVERAVTPRAPMARRISRDVFFMVG